MAGTRDKTTRTCKTRDKKYCIWDKDKASVSHSHLFLYIPPLSLSPSFNNSSPPSSISLLPVVLLVTSSLLISLPSPFHDMYFFILLRICMPCF